MREITYAEAKDLDAQGHFSFVAYGARLTMLVKPGSRWPMPINCIEWSEDGIGHFNVWVPV